MIKVAILILALMAYATQERHKVWQSEGALWEDIVAKSPLKPRGHLNLGNFYFARGHLDKAIQKYVDTANLKDNRPPFHYRSAALSNIGAIFIGQRRYAEAEKMLEMSVAEEPSVAPAINLAVIQMRTGKVDKALALLTKMLDKEPSEPSLLFNRAEAYRLLGRCAEAEVDYLAAYRENPDSPVRTCDVQ